MMSHSIDKKRLSIEDRHPLQKGLIHTITYLSHFQISMVDSDLC